MKKHGTIEGETGSDSWERGRAKDVKLKYCCGSAVCGRNSGGVLATTS